MNFDVGHTWGRPTNKWLGTYERELALVIEEIIGLEPSLIVDIGCAEGYYAVGLARALRCACVVAFDADPISLWQCWLLARSNDVAGRIRLKGYCGIEKLRRCATEKAVIVCDVEGGEELLLDPEKIPVLRKCCILVELHKSPTTNISTGASLEQRFGQTHLIKRIMQETRRPRSIGAELSISANPSLLAMWADEMRDPDQSWLWLTPK